MSVGLSLLITFILVLANGFFSMSEMALVNAKKVLLDKQAQEGDSQAQKASDLASDTSQFLATIQVAITLVGFFASAAAATSLSEPLAAVIAGLNIDWLTAIAPGLSFVVITLFVSYLSIVIGELVPKRIALASAESIAKKVAGPIMVFKTIAKPLVWVTSASADGLAKLLHVKSADDRQNVSEEEIKYLVTDNEELIDDEKRMIHEIIDLGDMTVREAMQPRVDMIVAEDNETVRQVIDRMRGTGYSRIPVYHEDFDQITGIAYFKDLISPLMDDKEDDPVGKYTFEPLFVPETKPLYTLLSEMQLSKQQLAIVVDEYGGTDGLITIEDIIEEIVGDIEDETDSESEHIIALSDNEWIVDGRFPCEEAEELGWPVRKTDDHETIAGWLMDTVDTVPQVGDQFDIEGYTFKIQSMRRRRISAIRVVRMDDPEATDEVAD